jgi:predicted dehydrogenase
MEINETAILDDRGFIQINGIEAKDFLTAIAEKRTIWPSFEEGMEVNRIVTAALDSSAKQAWVTVADY